MNDNELPEGIEIKRCFERERLDSLENQHINDYKPYIYYKIYLEGGEVGIANYKLQDQNWYIDLFTIYEGYRKKGRGSELLKFISQEMWSVKRIPIKTYPVNIDDFIEWLVKRKFQKIQKPNYAKPWYLLYPEDEKQA